jgi:Uma2 family endonuclease
MTNTQTQLSFEEYLTYDDGTDNRYELVDGELVMVPLPTGEHSDVIDFLSDTFKAEISKQGQPWIVKRDVGVYVGINPKTGKDRSRTPDLCVITQAQ